jgi:hypothetical protein
MFGPNIELLRSRERSDYECGAAGHPIAGLEIQMAIAAATIGAASVT